MAGVIVRERDIRGFSSGGREGFPKEVAALLELTTNHDCRTPLSLMETKFSSVRLSGSLFPYPSSLHYGCPPPPVPSVSLPDSIELPAESFR